MNEYLSGFILGLCQGLTEFLPVSSSGHLILLESLGVGEPDVATNLLLHLATLLAVIIVYRKKLLYLIKHPTDTRVKIILLSSAVSAIPAMIVRYFLPQNERWLPFCFITTSVILLLPKIVKPSVSPLDNKWIRKSVIVGLSQGVACINGISRSGTTVTALSLVGADSEESADTSFLLAIPIIIASCGVELITDMGEFKLSGGVFVGIAVAFLVGIVAIKSFVSIIKKKKTFIFSIYTFLLGVACFFLV